MLIRRYSREDAIEGMMSVHIRQLLNDISELNSVSVDDVNKLYYIIRNGNIFSNSNRNIITNISESYDISYGLIYNIILDIRGNFNVIGINRTEHAIKNVLVQLYKYSNRHPHIMNKEIVDICIDRMVDDIESDEILAERLDSLSDKYPEDTLQYALVTTRSSNTYYNKNRNYTNDHIETFEGDTFYDIAYKITEKCVREDDGYSDDILRDIATIVSRSTEISFEDAMNIANSYDVDASILYNRLKYAFSEFINITTMLNTGALSGEYEYRG